MSRNTAPQRVGGHSAASVSGMFDPVPYHPLLAGAPLDHQAEPEVGIFGHFYLQAPSCVPADDWPILRETTTHPVKS